MPEKHKGGGKNRRLTPELATMWRREHRGEAKDKSPEEKKAHRQKQNEKLAAMSESELGALRTQLQAKWNALTPEEKKKVEQKLNERGGGGGGGGKGKKKKKKGHAGQGGEE